jgi:hypothetical protein
MGEALANSTSLAEEGDLDSKGLRPTHVTMLLFRVVFRTVYVRVLMIRGYADRVSAKCVVEMSRLTTSS